LPARSLRIVDRFAPEAGGLREAFETRAGDERRAEAGRFVWDWWHVPGQYTHLRTPAWHYFPKKLYESFHTRLVLWGRENLGCHDVSPPWLSAYVDGCGQELHSDVPHGPWAFVFSLTPWRARTFRGGTTMLLKDETLDYWKGFGERRAFEADAILERVPALFNRLLVFDPRVPHGVEKVHGAQGLLDARLVIHGWFVEPRPFIKGPIPVSRAENVLGDFIEHLPSRLPLTLEQGLHGTMSLRLKVSAAGRVTRVERLTDTLRTLGAGASEAQISKAVVKAAQILSFGRLRGPAQITLPILFR
jgi:hypothetical protein